MKSNGLFIHPPKNKGRICSNCGSEKTHITKEGWEQWYHRKDDYNKLLCCSCYWKIYPQPKEDKRKHWNNIKNNRLDFCGVNIILSFPLPRDICEVCDITKKERRIDRHHYFYCRIIPWACTISICKKCHGKITNKGKIKSKSTIRTCLICNRTDSYKKIHYKYKDGHICSGCYQKLIRNNKKSQV